MEPGFLLKSTENRSNPSGLCSLSPSSSNSVLAFPGLKAGQVQLVDLAATERSPLNITAHDSPLVSIALNVEGMIFILHML